MSTLDSSRMDERFNEKVKPWGHQTNASVKMALAGIGARRTGRLIREVKVQFGQQYGRVNRVSFGFPRYMVFLEKGARKGYGGAKGSRWMTNGEWRRTQKTSLGKMDTGRSSARPAFNPTMDKAVPVLAGIVAKFYADMAVNAIVIK